MEIIDIAVWVANENDPNRRTYKAAVHIVLAAIASNPEINSQMVMKGGILLAIRYKSSRYTRDVDFSTRGKFQEFDRDRFLTALEQALVTASEEMDYGLACAIQSMEVRPSNPQASFPTLKLRVGYAYKDDVSAYKRLRAKQSSDVVDIDYSFNEAMQRIDIIQLGDGKTLSAYSFSDLVAEKLRAILQQEVRARYRRQDVYDIYLLIKSSGGFDPEELSTILKAFLASAGSRELVVGQFSLRKQEIRDRSMKEYHQLKAEIEGELPDFDTAYDAVRELYESLPWLTSTS